MGAWLLEALIRSQGPSYFTAEPERSASRVVQEPPAWGTLPSTGGDGCSARGGGGGLRTSASVLRTPLRPR